MDVKKLFDRFYTVENARKSNSLDDLSFIKRKEIFSYQNEYRYLIVDELEERKNIRFEMCYIRIFELCDRLLLNNKIERKRCKRCPASFLQRKYVCQRECMFDIFLIYIGNYDSMLP